MTPRSQCCGVLTEATFDEEIGVSILTCPACLNLCAPQDYKLTTAQQIAAITTGNILGDVMLRDALTALAHIPATDAEVMIYCPVHRAVHIVVPYRDTLCLQEILKKWGLR